jgi:tetratricopeptide (TPR) repeat protein
VLAASLLALSLIGGVIGTTLGMLRATFAEAEAVREAAEKTAALGEKESALATAEANEIRAKAAQKDAQDNLKDALAAVDQMLTRVAEDRLTDVPQMETIRRDLLLDALKFYHKFLDEQSDDPVIRRETLLAQRRVGRIHHQLGQHKDAVSAHRNALEMFDKLGGIASADPDLLIEMVLCHIELSWPLNHLGNVDESRQHIRRAVEVADKLDKKVPDNLRYVLNARNNLASILLSEDPHAAEILLKENLALADDAFNLEGVHRGLARVFTFTGRPIQAEESTRQALKYANQLAAEQPSANWVQAALARDQRDLASSIMKQRPSEAQELQAQAVVILDKLATDFPKGPNYRMDLAEALIEDARILTQLGKTDDAEKAYRRGIDVYEKLAADFPMMPAFWEATRQSQEELAFFHRSFGGHYLWQTRRLKEADRSYQAAVDGFDKLALMFPDMPAYGARGADCRVLLGVVAHFEGRGQDAERHLRQGIQLAEQVAQKLPGDLALRAILPHGYRFLAWVLGDTGSPQEVEKALVQSLAIADQLVAEFPNNEWCLFEQGETWRAVAVHHFRNGRIEEGRRFYQRVVDSCEHALANYPDWANKVTWLNNSAEFLVRHADGSPRAARLAVELAQKSVALRPGQAASYRVLGSVLSQQKKLDEAVAAYRKAIDIEPTYAPAHNALAWFLSTCADAKLRDSAQAVVHAKKAVELDTKNGSYANTLGVAYYRTSDWKAAIATFATAIELHKGGDSFDWFFLAMAHWQLGEKDQARDFYDQAVQWMDKNLPTNEELCRFREEAAKLLGVNDKTD